MTNCNINNFNVGINTLNGYYGNFSNLNLFNNSGNGLSCGFDNSTYTNINSSFNGAIGLYFWAVMYSDISNLNSFSNTNEGIYFNSIYVVRANLINTYSNLGRGFRIYSSSDSNFSIINSYNNINDGIYMFSIFNCIFNNFNLTNNRYGMYVYDSNSNIFTNGSSYLNMNSNIFFRKVGSSPATNNTFYNNFLGNSSKITSDYTFDTSYKNYFNYSGIGNRWDDMPTCLSTTTVNGNIICTNPANYTINATLNIYDFAPFDYRYTEPIGAEQSNLNSIFPSLSLNSILFNLIILFGYFIFN